MLEEIEKRCAEHGKDIHWQWSCTTDDLARWWKKLKRKIREMRQCGQKSIFFLSNISFG
jgi:hypothetical protein